MLDQTYSAKTIARVAVRKLTRRLFGVSDRIEPVASVGLLVFASANLDGGGSGFGQDYLRILKNLRVHDCDRIFELCAGPGFIGYSLLAHGLCRHLVLADINPVAVRAARMTAEFNAITDRVSIYESNGLTAIPADEQWDLVVGNPPHFAQWNGRAKLLFEDPGWALHRTFYGSVRQHLRPGARVVLQENTRGSSGNIFEPMIVDGGGTLVGIHPGPDLGGGAIYYVISRWD